jgi:hypothetical protein
VGSAALLLLLLLLRLGRQHQRLGLRCQCCLRTLYM